MPFADELIGRYTAENLARAVSTVLPDEPLAQLRAAPNRLDGLGLRERADLLRDALLTDIPSDYAALAAAVRAARTASAAFSGWMIWPVTAALATKAIDDGGPAEFDDAMSLLAELTGLLTSEFAIRTLLRHDLDRALAIMRSWVDSEDIDVRRLASEGARPYLPWSVRVPELISRSGVTVPILDALYRDRAEYVRRSVANHLNDLSRDHPDTVVDTASRWMADPDENTPWVIRHGLRTLVKRGHPGALEVLGFSAPTAALQIDGPHLARGSIVMGEEIEIRGSISNLGEDDVRVVIDYVVHHRKANGTLTPKTFKLTTATVTAGGSLTVRRVHSFRPISTRRYYPGAHAIALQVNGVATAPIPFELTAL